jgi:hypothetical protein
MTAPALEKRVLSKAGDSVDDISMAETLHAE